LTHSGGEDVDQNENSAVANDTWWDRIYFLSRIKPSHISSQSIAHSVLKEKNCAHGSVMTER
jgi:hypothetical protein